MLLVHVTAPSSFFTDAYTQAEDAVRREQADRWIPLAGGLGSLRVPWWRQRLTWRITGSRLEVDEDLHFSLAHAPTPRPDQQPAKHCGTRPPQDPPGAALVRHRATLTLTPRYRASAGDGSARIEVRKICTIPSLTMDPAPLIAAHLTTERARLTEILAARLEQGWPIKRQVAAVWDLLQQPIVVDDETRTWLLLKPRLIRTGTIGMRGGWIAATVGILVEPELVRGTLPSQKVRPLPQAEGAGASERFHTTLDVPVPFHEADERLRDTLLGQQFGHNPGVVTVVGARFAPAGHRAQVELDLDVAGIAALTLQLTGTPVFDEPTQTVHFAQLDYAIKNRSAFADLAESLLHDEFRRQLERRLRIPLSDRLEAARRRLNQELNRPWKGGTLQGSMTSLRVLGLSLEPAHIRVRFRSEGELHYTVAGQPIPPPGEPMTGR